MSEAEGELKRPFLGVTRSAGNPEPSLAFVARWP